MNWLRRWWIQYRQTTDDARYARGGLVDMGVPPPQPTSLSPEAIAATTGNTAPPEDFDG